MLIKNSIEVYKDFYWYQTAGASINQSGRRYTCGQMYRKLLNKLLEKATACHAWLNTKKDKPQKGLFIKCKKRCV